MQPSHFPDGLQQKCVSWARTGSESIQPVNLPPPSSLARPAVYHVTIMLSVSDVLRGPTEHMTHDNRIRMLMWKKCFRNWNAAVQNQHMHIFSLFSMWLPVPCFCLIISGSWLPSSHPSFLFFSLTLVWICWVHGTGSCGSLQRGGHNLW